MFKLTENENSVLCLADHGECKEGEVIYIGSYHWRSYRKWLDEGNIPEPVETQAEADARIRNERISEIQQRLNEIDMESVRAIRATSIGRGALVDETKLNALEDEAEALRQELINI